MYVHRASASPAPGRRTGPPRWLWLVAAILIVGGIAAAAFYGGAVAQRSGSLAGWAKLLRDPAGAAYNFGAAHIDTDSAPQHIFIDLKFKHYQKLLKKREAALQAGFLFREDDDYVPAEIRTGTETLPVKLRLKGDLLDHLRGDRWSFRIHVKDGKQFHGMRRFSIQHPRTRGYVWEWAVLEAMRREDVLAPRYGYLEVTLNGKRLGTYAYEEHFGKELLESQARRESVIVKLDESLRWREMHESGERTGRFMFWENAAIDLFNERTVRENPNLSKLYEAAVANIESLRQGKIAACDAFDCVRIARFWAVADLMGAAHALHWINLRFYYNPVTTKLEPIAFDCLGGYRLSDLSGTGYLELAEDRGHDDPNRDFMADPRFAALYVQALERVSRPEYLQELGAAIDPGVQLRLRAVQREWPWEDFDWGVLEHNQKLIRAFLDPPAALTARYDPSGLQGEALRVRVSNLLAFPVELLGAEIDGEPVELVAPPTVAGKPARGALDWSELTLDVPQAVRDARAVVDPPPPAPRVVLRHRILGDETVRESVAGLAAPEIDLQGVPSRAGNMQRHGFLEVDAAAREVRLPRGVWSVEGDLVVPAGWVVRAGPGTTLEFDEGAVFVSYSPVELAGTEQEPVYLGPKGESWSGFQVIEAGGRSTLDHVSIRGTSAVDREGWTLTGGVTFYESPVHLNACLFSEAHGEDALNIIRSEFRMVDCVVRETAFDALDVDFGRGSVEGGRFIEIGNDGLDFSGSVVRIEDLVVFEAGDKAVSAGEASDVTLLSATIENVAIGLASKDRSQLRVSGCEIKGARIGVMAFQKKPEYGGAFAELKGTRLSGTQQEFVVEVGSRVHLDGKALPADARGVADELYQR